MKQITEDYVSFEVAKLLKEKGFDAKCSAYYISDDEIALLPITRDFNNNGIFLSAPTHQMTIKWLRKVQSIYITSEPDINDKHCFYPVIYTMTEESWDMQCFEELEKLSFDKPEQAVEAALLYVLKNLI